MDPRRHGHRRFRLVARLAFALGVLVTVAGAAAAVVVNGWPAKAQAPVALPAPATPLRVGALGRLEPGWKILQVSPASSVEAIVQTLEVEEGDVVQTGDLLAVLDIRERRQAALDEAEAQVLAATARLAQVRAGPKADDVVAQAAEVEQLDVAFRHADRQYARAHKLRTSNVISAEEEEGPRAERDRAKHLLEKAKALLASLRAVREEDVAAAEAEVSKALAGVRRAKAELAAAEVRSPLDGRILKIFARPGERVGQDGLLEMGDTENMQAVAEVHERDSPLVRVGQPAAVIVQSLAGEFRGTVAHVGWKVGRRTVFDNDPVKDTDARVVEVRIRLDKESSRRLAGLSYARVEVRIDAPEVR